jgi:hypothetical protein
VYRTLSLAVAVAITFVGAACSGPRVDVISSTPAPIAPTPPSTPVKPSPPVNQTVRIDGRVAAASGTCPTLTFAVSDETVTTTQATTFSGGTCPQVVNGVNVDVTGTRQTDRTIAATAVVIRR